MKQFNEKPSKLANLGQDVPGAMRHHFDTYENPEKKAERERAKKQKSGLKELKQQAIDQLTEVNFREVIQWYEFRKVADQIEGYQGPKAGTDTCLKALRDYVISQRGEPEYNGLVGKFNRLSSLMRRLRWKLRSFDQAKKHFEPKTKDSFTEQNGIKRPWVLKESFSTESIDYLANKTRAVQFGNSVPESEREYCLHNLANSIRSLESVLSFDFKTVAISFGARGKAGSVAHYQDSQKVIAINRGWDGALAHELGHAIDYSLGMVSDNIPQSIRSKYREKIQAADVGLNAHYYLKRVELFARLFEVYIRAILPECSDYLQTTFNPDVMPDLDAESIAWMSEALKSLTKNTQSSDLRVNSKNEETES